MTTKRPSIGDTTIILWDMDITSWLRKACAVANRNLTRREWAQYVGKMYGIRRSVQSYRCPRTDA